MLSISFFISFGASEIFGVFSSSLSFLKFYLDSFLLWFVFSISMSTDVSLSRLFSMLSSELLFVSSHLDFSKLSIGVSYLSLSRSFLTFFELLVVFKDFFAFLCLNNESSILTYLFFYFFR